MTKALTTAQAFTPFVNDPEYLAEQRRTALANTVAIRILEYRTEHGLSQTALGKLLRMPQANIARLEAADHEPSFALLDRLSRTLGMTFHLDFTPEGPQAKVA